MSLVSSVKPIIVVTGAGSGLGFGICHRLLVQLSQSTPIDTELLPGALNHGHASTGSSACNGLVLIMACRNKNQAQASRTELLRLLDAGIAGEVYSAEDKSYAEMFRERLVIDIAEADLSSVSSTLECLRYIMDKYTYVSHLICNAAMAPFIGINPIGAVKQLLRDPIAACTTPNYLRQSIGRKSDDGIGLVFQTNVFGHYLMLRTLLPQFEAYTKESRQAGRVIWVSSLKASSSCYVPDDPELLKSSQSYEASKYQMELIACHFNGRVTPATHIPLQFVIQPGTIPTALSRGYSTPEERKKHAKFLTMARLFGSRNHPSTTFKAAVSATCASLTAIDEDSPLNRKIHSHTDGFRDREYISMEILSKWDEAGAQQLIDYCENLCEKYTIS